MIKKFIKSCLYRHYPRIIRKDSIAGVEIHKDLLSEKYVNEFNYNFVEKDSQVINGLLF